MGLAKRYLEEVEARGWSSVDAQVCPACLDDSALAAAARAGATSDTCDYCGTRSDAGPIAAPVDLVLALIVDGLRAEYEDPVHQALYSTADGGYQVPTADTWDLLDEHEVTSDTRLRADLSNAIDMLWCQRDPYAAAGHEALLWGWQAFRRYVTTERRYTFLLPGADAARQLGWGEIPPEDMPNAIADAIADGELATVLMAGTEFWRARVHDASERPTAPGELGSPPPDAARANRMTAAGIGGFYGASTRDGALAEVRGYMDPSDHTTLGRFVTSRRLPVVNLVELPAVPSLFDADRRQRRPALRFLHGFAADVARPARPDDRQNLDYVPTQVVAEYLRYEFAHPDGPVAGVLWRSSKDPAVVDCVLFIANDACVDVASGWDSTDEPRLGLVPGSTEHLGTP